MELAIHNWMRAETLEHTLDRIHKLNYTHLEIQGAPESYDTQKTQLLLDIYGIKCWGSVTLMLEDRNLLSKDPTQRQMSVQYVKDVAKMVYELGGSVISLVPATVGKIVPDAHPEEEWEWAVKGIQEIYDYTEDVGLKIGIEPINRFETYSGTAQPVRTVRALWKAKTTKQQRRRLHLKSMDWRKRRSRISLSKQCAMC